MANVERKEYMKKYLKKYREEHKEKIKEQLKEYRENNKDQIKEYRKNNKEQNKEYQKEYNKTEQGIKSYRISNWKTIGVKHDDFSSLYEHYLNCKNCENCSIELREGNYGANKRCLDHDHETGEFRNVLCNSCNLNRR